MSIVSRSMKCNLWVHENPISLVGFMNAEFCLSVPAKPGSEIWEVFLLPVFPLPSSSWHLGFDFYPASCHCHILSKWQSMNPNSGPLSRSPFRQVAFSKAVSTNINLVSQGFLQPLRILPHQAVGICVLHLEPEGTLITVWTNRMC